MPISSSVNRKLIFLSIHSISSWASQVHDDHDDDSVPMSFILHIFNSVADLACRAISIRNRQSNSSQHFVVAWVTQSFLCLNFCWYYNAHDIDATMALMANRSVAAKRTIYDRSTYTICRCLVQFFACLSLSLPLSGFSGLFLYRFCCCLGGWRWWWCCSW